MPPVKLYTLSTCSHCKHTKQFLNELGVPYEYIDVDQLQGQERADMIEEVKKYCQERQNNVDPNKWIDHYTSNGWMVGKNKMKDWKAAVRTWEHKDNKGGIKLSGFAKKPTSQIASGEAETDEEWPVSNSSTRGL